MKKFLPRETSPHTIVTHLQNELNDDNIVEIYIVVRDRKGNYNETLYGDVGGLAFAILVLQKSAITEIQK
jgi:hypothetical protein